MNFRELLTESRVINEGITHVEDLILDQGTAGAQQALAALSGLAKDNSTITVKWDGFPAVIFGRDQQGRLVFMDKHMFDKVVKGKMSFMTIQSYDQERGANRSDLWDKEQALRPALEKVVPAVRNQFWMGDLMWTGRPAVQGDSYVFKPNTVEYRVKVKSDLGGAIAKSRGGIAVHTFIPGLGAGDEPLVGLRGLQDGAGIVFLQGEMRKKPTVKVDAKLVREAQAVIKKYGGAVDRFVSDLVAMKGKSVLTAMGPFITSMLEENDIQTDIVPRFLDFLSNKLSPSAQQTFLGANRDGWLYQRNGGAQGLLGIWTMWAAITQLKLSVKRQIDGQLGGSDVTAITDGATAHEGYVFGAGKDKLKLIDRLGFSRANFAKHRVPAEEIAAKKQMPLAAFCFGRMNPPTLGHELVMKKTVETGGKNSFIFLSSSHRAPDDPLDPQTKAAFIRKIYPEYAQHIVNDPVQGPIYAANWLYAKGFRNMAFIAGSDRLGKAPGSIEKTLNGWNSGPVRSTDNQFGAGGREHVNLTFISSGERDSDISSVSGISGSLARRYAAAGDEAGFERATGVDAKVKVGGRSLYQATREGMDLANNTAAPATVKTAARKQARKALKEQFEQDIQFHSRLNPAIWKNNRMIPEVADHLNAIARAFEKYLDISDLKIVDLTISGSNAAYTYTAYSDVDLHLVVDVPVGRQEFMRKYFDAKKNLFNEQHDITVNDQPVELYVQFSDQPHTSAGIYSVLQNRWIQKPRPVRANINHTEVQNKLMQYIKLIKSAIDGGTSADLERASAKIRDLRKSGLAATGEWGTDNLVFKILRNQGILDQLSTLKTRWQDQELSLEEEQL